MLYYLQYRNTINLRQLKKIFIKNKIILYLELNLEKTINQLNSKKDALGRASPLKFGKDQKFS
uniref:hypothetical protein n=1 Tax=Borreliella californiensis TaxID=373543 RepID=UPI003B20D963